MRDGTKRGERLLENNVDTSVSISLQAARLSGCQEGSGLGVPDTFRGSGFPMFQYPLPNTSGVFLPSTYAEHPEPLPTALARCPNVIPILDYSHLFSVGLTFYFLGTQIVELLAELLVGGLELD